MARLNHIGEGEVATSGALCQNSIMAKSPYITPAGHRRLSDELDELWLRKRPEVTRALSAAAAEGDRSENAEYIYRKKELRGIDRRIRYLRKRLDILKIVRDGPTDPTRAFFGAEVTVEDDQGQARYRIVGSDETDAAAGHISVDAPVARALLGKAVGDVVDVRIPEGSRELEILSIRYP